MFKNGNWEVGDVVRIKSDNPNAIEEFSGRSFEVFQLPTTNMEDDINFMPKDIKTGEWENYYRFHWELDEIYYRKEKLKKICTKLGI